MNIKEQFIPRIARPETGPYRKPRDSRFAPLPKSPHDLIKRPYEELNDEAIRKAHELYLKDLQGPKPEQGYTGTLRP